MELTGSAIMLLSVYFVFIFIASFFGGKLSAVMTMTHMHTQMLMSFISGFIIGIAIYHLLPHSLEYISGSDALQKAAAWMLFGIVLMVLLLRTFNFHQHEFDSREDLHDQHTHSNSSLHMTNLLNIILGLGLHSMTEGIALGASIQIDLSPGGRSLESLGVFLAILLHKPLDAYSIIGLMRSSGYGRRACALVNLLFALLCPLVMVLTFVGVKLLAPWDGEQVIGYILAFASGAFLCISLSDLLPEVQFHRHDRGKLTVIFLLGIFLSYGLHH